MENYRCNVQGIVQGVFYRKTINEAASQEGFNGYVKNMPDDSVEACVTCNAEDLEVFLKILHKGSPRSRVDAVNISECDECFEHGFEIRY